MIDSAQSSPMRTTTWKRAAAVALAPPSNAPTNAPGSVTRPTVRVWSKRRHQRLERGVASDAAHGLARGGAYGKPGLDLVPAPAQRLLQPPTGQGCGRHGAAENNAGHRDQGAQIAGKDGQPDDQGDGESTAGGAGSEDR